MSTRLPASRKPKGCILRALGFYALFLLCVVAVWLVVGHSVAAWQLRQERRAWAAAGMSMEALRERFPRAEDSAAARGLNQRVHRLRIHLVFEPDWRSTPDEDKLFQSANEYMRQFKAATVASLPPAPPDVRLFLDKHREELGEISTYLTTTEGIAWAIDLDAGPDSPMPSLLGHRRLQHLLLIEAVERQRHGDAVGSERMLDAAWRDNLALSSRPDLISQLIALALATERGAVLRSMPVTSSDWSTRLAVDRSLERLPRAFQAEAYNALAMARQYRGPGDLQGPPPANAFAGGAIAVVIRTLTVPYVRLGMAGMSRHVREGGALVMANDTCAMDIAAFAKQRDAEIPRWNLIAKVGAPSVVRPWIAAAGADLDAELTSLVLQARACQDQGGSWGQTVDVPSQVCKEIVWSHRHEGNGALTIAARPRPAFDLERAWSFTISPTPMHP